MNAVTISNHKTNTFKWLLKREFWENRGGFLWAPLITGGIVSFLTAVMAVIGVVQARRHGDELQFNIGGDMAEHARQIGGIGDTALLIGISLTILVLAFVVFFYALGCLYDDRRDRSVLFWKSLPASDLQIVLSKATWALLLAPIVAIVAGVLIGVVLWIIAGASLAAAGVPSASAVFTHAHPFSVIGNQLTMIPVYLLWALPAVGWLMLCSAWARSKPFLWAILIPVFSGILISWFNLMNVFHLDDGWFWKNVVLRGLFSVFPGTWYASSSMHDAMSMKVDGPGDLANAIEIGRSWALFGSAELWIGALAGAAMIYAAIQLRRRRELAD